MAQRSDPASPTADPATGASLADRVELASRSLLALSIRAMAQLDPTISPTQLRGLMVLDERGGCNQGALASALRVSSSATSRLVDRLVTSGLVSRGVPAHSRREVLLELTSRGRLVVRNYQDERRAVFAEALADLPPRDLTALLQGLEAVHARESARR